MVNIKLAIFISFNHSQITRGTTLRSPQTLERKKSRSLQNSAERSRGLMLSTVRDMMLRVERTSAIADDATSAVSTEKMTITFLKYWIFKKDVWPNSYHNFHHKSTYIINYRKTKKTCVLFVLTIIIFNVKNNSLTWHAFSRSHG